MLMSRVQVIALRKNGYYLIHSLMAEEHEQKPHEAKD